MSIGASVVWRGLDRVFALAKHVLIAGAIGLSAQLDVFYLVNSLLAVLVFSWGNLVDVLAVPRLVTYQAENRTKEFDTLSGGLLVLCFLLGAVLCGAAFWGRAVLSFLPAGLDPARQALLREAFIWVLPVAFLYVPFRFLGALFRSSRIFSLFYQSQTLIGLVSLILIYFWRDHPTVLLWSFSISVTCAFLYLFNHARKHYRVCGNPFADEVQGVLRLAPGLLLLQAAGFLFQLSDSLFVSFLQTGAVSALAYGWTLIALVPGMFSFGGSFITVFSEKWGSGEDLSVPLNDLISFGILGGFSLGVFFFAQGNSIISLLLERGLFSSQDTALTAKALAGYCLGLVPLLLIGACDQVCQVMGRVGLQVRRVLFGLVLNAILNGLFVFLWHWDVGGVSLATSVSYVVMLVSSLHGIHSKEVRIAWGSHFRWILIVILGAFGALACAAPWNALGDNAWLVIPKGLTYLLVLFLFFWCVPVHEGGLVRKTAKRIFRGWRFE